MSKQIKDFISKDQIVEFNELPSEQKLRYLRAYWDKASDFFSFNEFVLPDDEVYAQIKKFKEKPRPEIRQVVKLNPWKWKLDAEMRGIKDGYFGSDYDDSTWENTDSPHNVNFAPTDPIAFGKINADLYNGPYGKSTTVYLGEYALWYRTSVPIARKDIESKRAFLSFESCSIKTTAWVNDWPIILEHYGLYPFSTEITQELRRTETGQKTQFTVEIVSQPTTAPDFFYNCLEYAYAEKKGEKDFETPCLNWGGLNGSVELSLTSPTYIKDLFVYTKEITRDNKGILAVRLEIDNTTTDMFEGKILLSVKPWYPAEIDDKEQEVILQVHARPLGTTVIEKDLEIKDPLLWGSWDPNLYLAHAKLVPDKETAPCDDVIETFGIRTFTAKDGKFYLNNKPIFVSAVHDQGIYPNVSTTCPSDYWIVQSYLLHRAMGFVASRFPSDNRVHYRRIAELADQIGIMLIWEGYCSVWIQNPSIDDLATRDVPLMIRDLRNHPSIVTWVMGDETYYSNPSKTSESTYQNKRERYNELVHKLGTEADPSRLINPVGCWAEDLALVIEKFVSKGLSIEQARERSLEMLPIFDAPNVYWSIHKNPGHTNNEPMYAVMRRIDKLLCGTDKPVTFDEFGCESMPDWTLSTGEWWYERWTINPLLAGGFKVLEEKLVGKKLKLEDWQISQAYQATILWRAISYMRETGAYAGFGTGCLRDAFNFYIGLVDFRGRAKLAFFVTKNALDRFFISAMHGNYVFKREDPLSITIANSGPDLRGVKLVISISNEKKTVKEQKIVNNLTLPRGVASVFNYEFRNSPADLYSVEYSLLEDNGAELGRSLDMFYIE